jgi:hypothetical protein
LTQTGDTWGDLTSPNPGLLYLNLLLLTALLAPRTKGAGGCYLHQPP